MNEGSHFGRFKSCFFPLPCLEPILHEIGKVAGIIFFNSGGGYIKGFTEQALYRTGRQGAPGRLRNLPYILQLPGPFFQPAHSNPGGPGYGIIPSREGKLTGRSRSHRPKLFIQLRLINGFYIKYPGKPLHHKGGSAPAVAAGLGICDNKLPGGLCKRGIDIIQLPAYLLIIPVFKLQPQLIEYSALLGRKHPAAAGYSRKGIIGGPQHYQALQIFLSYRLKGTHGYNVDSHGYGAHIILGQYQFKEFFKLLLVHRCIAQYFFALLQSLNQDIPKLPVFIGKLQLSLLQKLLRYRRQPLCQLYFLNKGIQSHNLLPCVFCRPAVLPEPFERRGNTAPDFIYEPEQPHILFCPVRYIAPGIHCPGLVPGPGRFSADIPGNAIVFQQVNVVALYPSQICLQISENISV